MKMRSAIPQSIGERFDSITANGSGNESRAGNEVETSTPGSSGGNVSDDYEGATTDMPLAEGNKAKGEDETGEDIYAAGATLGEEEEENRRAGVTRVFNVRKLETVIIDRVSTGKRVQTSIV